MQVKLTCVAKQVNKHCQFEKQNTSGLAKSRLQAFRLGNAGVRIWQNDPLLAHTSAPPHYD
jgi:hypothetical protein